MALWMVRAGRNGEYENVAIELHLVIIGWQELPDLTTYNSRDELVAFLERTYPHQKREAILNWAGQIWAFVRQIEIGDLIVLPLKTRRTIALGKIIGPYQYRRDLPMNLRHTRQVKWLKEVPRNEFDQDLLYSFGALQTVCRVHRNNAEERIAALLEDTSRATPQKPQIEEIESVPFDLEQFSKEQIIQRIEQHFKGHAMARLVAAILQAQGYETFVSPEGPDEGLDIVAGAGPMGCGSPRIAVQVKSGNAPVGKQEIDQLRGAMSRIKADLGLFVSWAGFKGSVKKTAATFFEIRLWDANDLVNALLQTYEHLPADIRAELPLKRIWILVPEEG